jgi:hypothetical protein
MNDDRMQVLQMLAAGQITVEEAERLIAALESPPAGSAGRAVEGAAAHPRHLRILVEEHEADGEAPTKVNIRVPFQLLRAGVRLASLIPNGAKGKINDALHKNGVPIDVNQLKPEDLDQLLVHLDNLTIDVEEKDTKVTIFAE